MAATGASSAFTTGRTELFPLDRAGRLARDVVDDAVNAAYLVDDARADPREHVVGQLYPVRRHAVARVDGAHRERLLVRAGIAHHADRLHRKQHAERLPDRFVDPRGADLFV